VILLSNASCADGAHLVCAIVVNIFAFTRFLAPAGIGLSAVAVIVAIVVTSHGTYRDGLPVHERDSISPPFPPLSLPRCTERQTRSCSDERRQRARSGRSPARRI